MEREALNIIKVPTRHFADRKKRIDLIVIHAMAEWVIENDTYYHCTDFLQKIGLSAHALCLPDGRIVETVDVKCAAFHAKGFNDRSIGIEFVVEGGHDLDSLIHRMDNRVNSPYSEVQYRWGGEWLRQCAKNFGLDFKNITTHAALDPERKKDPGGAFDMSAIEAVLSE